MGEQGFWKRLWVSFRDEPYKHIYVVGILLCSFGWVIFFHQKQYAMGAYIVLIGALGDDWVVKQLKERDSLKKWKEYCQDVHNNDVA